MADIHSLAGEVTPDSGGVVPRRQVRCRTRLYFAASEVASARCKRQRFGAHRPQSRVGRRAKVASQKWHTDKSFRELPSLATILHARIIPPSGGDTCFANMIFAYETLSEADKIELTVLVLSIAGNCRARRLGD
jgi:alpha-ketoglutarate-dependent taurine dioxygenase